MTDAKFDVLGIGNAIVDVIAKTEDDFLVREKLIKGSMRLIETSEAERLYGLMGQAIQTSGGCAGNTAAGVASFGGRAAFIGKVADDELGRVYRHDMHALGIHFATVAAQRRRSDRALDDPDHAGRRADDEHLSRRLASSSSPPDIDESAVGGGADHLSRGLSLGPRRWPRRPSARPRRSPIVPDARSRSPFPIRSASTASATSSSA